MAAWQIPLQAQSPQIQTPMQVQAGVMTLKQMAQQGQMAEQQIKAAEMANEQHKRDLQDQDIMRRAYMESSGDMDKFQQAAAKLGASPKAITAIQQHILQTKETLSKIHESDLKVQQGHTQAIGSAAQGLLGMPDEQSRAAAWPGVRADLIKRGSIKPEDAPEQYPGDAWVTFHRNNAVGAGTAVKNELETRRVKAQEDAAQARVKSAETAAQRWESEEERKQGATAAQQLGAAADIDQYRRIYRRTPAGAAAAFMDPYADDFDFEGAKSHAQKVGMTSEQQYKAGQGTTTRPITSRTSEGTFLIFPNGPDKPPTVQEVRSPSGKPLAAPTGTGQDRLAENDRRRELAAGSEEEQKIYDRISNARGMLEVGKDAKGQDLSPDDRARGEETINRLQQRLSEIYSRRVQLGYSKPEDVGFPTTPEQADEMERKAQDTRAKVGTVLATKDGEQFQNPFEPDNPKQTMDANARKRWQATYRAANQTLINARAGRRNLGSSSGATQVASAAAYSTANDNNPLNITLGPATKKWVDSGDATVKEANGKKFLAFKDPGKGLAAGQELLFGPTYADQKVGRGLMTFSGDDYGPEVAREAGIDPKTLIKDLTPQQKSALVGAMAKREGWKAELPGVAAATKPPAAQPAVPAAAPKPSEDSQAKPGAPAPQGGKVVVTINGAPHVFASKADYDKWNAATEEYLKKHPEYDSRIPEEKRPVAASIDGVKRVFANPAEFQKFKADHPEYRW